MEGYNRADTLHEITVFAVYVLTYGVSILCVNGAQDTVTGVHLVAHLRDFMQRRSLFFRHHGNNVRDVNASCPLQPTRAADAQRLHGLLAQRHKYLLNP